MSLYALSEFKSWCYKEWLECGSRKLWDGRTWRLDIYIILEMVGTRLLQWRHYGESDKSILSKLYIHFIPCASQTWSIIESNRLEKLLQRNVVLLKTLSGNQTKCASKTLDFWADDIATGQNHLSDDFPNSPLAANDERESSLSVPDNWTTL